MEMMEWDKAREYLQTALHLNPSDLGAIHRLQYVEMMIHTANSSSSSGSSGSRNKGGAVKFVTFASGEQKGIGTNLSTSLLSLLPVRPFIV